MHKVGQGKRTISNLNFLAYPVEPDNFPSLQLNVAGILASEFAAAPANGMSWIGCFRKVKLCGLLNFFNFQKFLIFFLKER